MKYFVVQLIFIFSFCMINAQSYEYLDINKLEISIKDENSKYFYPGLFVRYSENDTTLNLEEYKHLYYGHSLQPYFNPNISRYDDSVRALRKYLSSGNVDFKRIIEIANFTLRLDPFYLDGLYILSLAYNNIGDVNNSNKWIDKYDKIIKTIWGSGNGKSPETAFVVLSVADEFAMIDAMKLKFLEHSTIKINGKTFDTIKVEPNESGIEKVFFNIDLFLEKSINLDKK